MISNALRAEVNGKTASPNQTVATTLTLADCLDCADPVIRGAKIGDSIYHCCIMPPVDLVCERRYMPKLDIVPIEEARGKSASEGKRAQVLREYIGYIDQLTKGQAGRLVAGAGETTATVRRRIGAAARAAGKNLTIRRAGDEVYFWVERRRAANGRGRGASS